MTEQQLLPWGDWPGCRVEKKGEPEEGLTHLRRPGYTGGHCSCVGDSGTREVMMLLKYC